MELFAKKCDATLKGMNSGYVVLDGMKYFSDDIYVLIWLDDQLPDIIRNASNETKLEWLYNNEYYYYTEWDDETEFEFIEISGKLYELTEV